MCVCVCRSGESEGAAGDVERRYKQHVRECDSQSGDRPLRPLTDAALHRSPVQHRQPVLQTPLLLVSSASPHTHTHTHPFNGPSPGTTRVSRYQKGKTNLDFTEARDSERQWHQLGHMQVCTSLQTNNHASTPPLRFLQAGCPSCRSTNSVKALKGFQFTTTTTLLLRPR